MFRATRDWDYYDVVERTLDFIKNDLYYNGLEYHEWSEDTGRPLYYCTGCNFLLLDVIYELHQVLEEM